MQELERWFRQAEWFYANCVATIGGKPECYDAYVLAIPLGLCILAIALAVAFRRGFRNWRELKLNEQRILVRREVAPPEVMEQYYWKGDASASADLPYSDLVTKIKDEKAKRKGTDESR